VGIERVRFGRVRREFPYRACDVEAAPSSPYDPEDPLAEMERVALLAAAKRLLPRGAAAWWLPPVTSSEAPLEVVVNTLALSLRLDAAAKLEMLALDSVFDRARTLREHLERACAAPGPEPGESAGRN
jgi:Lon protease-like protein